MIGISDFKETLHNFFIKNNAVCKFDLNHIKGFNLAIEDTMVMKNSRNPNNNLADNIDKFYLNLKKNDISQVSTISNGVNTFNKFGNNLEYENIFSDYSKIIFLENYLEIFEKKNKEFKKFKTNFDNIFFKDYLINSLFADKYKFLIEKKSKQNNFCFLNTLVNKENQMTYLFENDFVDCIYSSPLPILLTNKPIFIIYDINFEKKEFFYYSFEKLAENLEIEEKVLRSCLILSFLYFCLNEDINKKFKIPEALDFKNLNYNQNYSICIERRLKLIEDHIDLYKESVPKNSFMKLLKMASDNFGFEKSHMVFFYDTFFKIPIFSPQIDVQFFPKKTSLSTKNYYPNHKNKELITFFCLNYIERELFELVNKCNKNTHVLEYPLIQSLEYDIIVNNFYKPNLEVDLSKIINIFKIDEKKKFSYSLIYNKKKYPLQPLENIPELKTIYVEDLDPKKTSITNIALDFKRFIKEEKNFIHYNENINLNENHILHYLYINLLNNVGFLNKEKRTMNDKGEYLVKIKKFRTEEEIILFFLALKFNLLNPQSFMGSINNIFSIKIKNNDDIEKKNRDNYDKFKFNIIAAKKKYIVFKNTNIIRLFLNVTKNKSYINNYINTTIIQSTKIFTKLMETNKIVKEKSEIIKASLTKTLKYYFNTIELISKISIILKNNFNLPEPFDFQNQQFSECLNLISKSLNSSLKSDLAYLFFNTNLNGNLNFLENIKKKLPFKRFYSSTMGAILKNILVKFIFYEHIKKNYVINCDFLKEELTEDFIEKNFNVYFSFIHYLKKIDEFIHNLNNKFHNFNKNYKEVFENLKFAKILLRDIIKFIENNA